MMIDKRISGLHTRRRRATQASRPKYDGRQKAGTLHKLLPHSDRYHANINNLIQSATFTNFSKKFLLELLQGFLVDLPGIHLGYFHLLCDPSPLWPSDLRQIPEPDDLTIFSL